MTHPCAPPDSGRTNREELARELADVKATAFVAARQFDLPRMTQRTDDKVAGFYRWHAMIEAAK